MIISRSCFAEDGKEMYKDIKRKCTALFCSVDVLVSVLVVWDTSAGTGKLCILGHLGLVFIWSCFVFCLLFLLFYVSLRNLCSGTCRKIRSLLRPIHT